MVVLGRGAVSYERGTPVRAKYAGPGLESEGEKVGGRESLLSSEFGTNKTVLARFCSWLEPFFG